MVPKKWGFFPKNFIVEKKVEAWSRWQSVKGVCLYSLASQASVQT